MERNLKLFIQAIVGRGTREFTQSHVLKLIINEEEKFITLMIDKLYSFNILKEKKNIQKLLTTTKNVFWEDYYIVLKLSWWQHVPSEREKAIPNSIRYP